MKYRCIKSGGLRRYPASSSACALSLTTIFGLPRSITSRSSSRATRMPESDVSATSARHWRVQSSRTDAEAAAVGADPAQSRATTGRSASSEPATRSAGEILRDLNHPIETGSELRMEVSDEERRPLFTLRVITEAHEQGRLSRRRPRSSGYMTWSGRHTTAAGFGVVTAS